MDYFAPNYHVLSYMIVPLIIQHENSFPIALLPIRLKWLQVDQFGVLKSNSNVKSTLSMKIWVACHFEKFYLGWMRGTLVYNNSSFSNSHIWIIITCLKHYFQQDNSRTMRFCPYYERLQLYMSTLLMPVHGYLLYL